MTADTGQRIDFGIVYGIQEAGWIQIKDLPAAAVQITATVSPRFLLHRVDRRTVMIPLPEWEWPPSWKPGGKPGHPPKPIPKVPDVTDTDVDPSIPVTVGAHIDTPLVYRVYADTTTAAPCIPVTGELTVTAADGTVVSTVPLSYVKGPDITVASRSVAVRQGQPVNVGFRAQSSSAQPQTFTLAGGDWGNVVVDIPPHSSVSSVLPLKVPTNVGISSARSPVTFVPLLLNGVIAGMKGFNVRLPIELEAAVSPAQVTVTAAGSPAVTAAPGTEVTVPIRISLNEATEDTNVLLDAYSSPWATCPATPFGLGNRADPTHLPTITKNVDASGARVAEITLTIPADASAVTDLPVLIRWSAFDGKQTGYLSLTLTVPPVTRSFTVPWGTPAGTALNGWVTYTLSSTGDYQILCHAHDSTVLVGYDFRVRAALIVTSPPAVPGAAATAFALTSQHSGHVTHDTDANITEAGTDPRIRAQWSAIVANNPHMLTPEVSSSPTGVFGTLLDAAGALLDLSGKVAGASLGLVVTIGHELGVFNDVGSAIGAVAGMVACGGDLFFAVGTGVAVAAVVDSAITARELHPNEVALLHRVFGGSLDTSKIRLTNLSGIGGRAFTFPSPDGNLTYIHLGHNFDPNDVSALAAPDSGCPAPGELLVHEATHAWQIERGGFLAGTVCAQVATQVQNIHGADVYRVGPPGLPWNQYGPEAQAALVDQCYGGVVTIDAPLRTPRTNSTDPLEAPADPYFRYIRDNIRPGID